MEIVIDTHALAWYLNTATHSKLTKKAKEAIDKAVFEGLVYVPVIVLTELLHMSENGKIQMDFSKLISELEVSQSFRILPLDADVLKASMALKGLEIHDRLIAASAIIRGVPLVTKDGELHAANLSVIW